ncbi:MULTISPECIES: tyrosine-type recombinase/integrase [unclassified Nocardioides]|uniref:tyrosine-type recombinase/integrase n=1 Tax=unclassified Nocardioides TaxID=2615069 RepID=UPI0006FB009B|nr:MULTISPECIES: tyrosine-type recombinase/integrase [unclassified Nocardioides]KRA37874.1 integrase [Nocardioides sp. Root614]KRA91834.1 integrase [Nocardioides sp. Root682]
MAWVAERTIGDGTTRFLAQYRDPEGRIRSAGTHSSRRAAERAGNREEQRVLTGSWHDRTLGAVSFQQYVERDWLPSKHIEATTRAAYISNLDKHFFPFFGTKAMYQVTPSLVQDWVTKAAADGLSGRSISKYHTMLHSIFKRAVRDKLIVTNPCEHTELPKVITKKTRTLTPDEFESLIKAVPDEHRLMVETAIETGMRWGELIALKPRHVDFLRRTVTVQDTIVEVSKKHSPTGERYVSKPYPKDNEPRTFAVRQDWLDAVAEHIELRNIGRDDLLFTTRAGTPISRNTFRTRVWLPAVKASGVGFAVRIHDLRHAHASWLLAGGSDLKSVMDRLGHAQIQTTQKYLHALKEADQHNLDALDRMQRRR